MGVNVEKKLFARQRIQEKRQNKFLKRRKELRTMLIGQKDCFFAPESHSFSAGSHAYHPHAQRRIISNREQATLLFQLFLFPLLKLRFIAIITYRQLGKLHKIIAKVGVIIVVGNKSVRFSALHGEGIPAVNNNHS